MVLRERTSELHNIFETIKQQNPGLTSSPPPTKLRPSISTKEMREFNQCAQHVSARLAYTSDSLTKISKLMQTQTVFDDRSQEIGKMISLVQYDVSELMDQLKTLAELQAAIRGATKQCGKHNDAVVQALRIKLLATTTSFKTLINARSDEVNKTRKRRSIYESSKAITADEVEDVGGTDQRQDLSRQVVMQNADNLYAAERRQQIIDIEVSIRELGSMFTELQNLVHQQDELLQRIDENVDQADVNVNAGLTELMTYLKTISSGRGLMLKLLGILFVALLFFGFIVVR